MSKKYIMKNSQAVEVSEEIYEYLVKSDRRIRCVEEELDHLYTGSATELIHTTLHELRHAYQFSAVAVYNAAGSPEHPYFAEIGGWSDNLAHYQGELPYSYSTQPIETDAKYFADVESGKVLAIIR